MQMRQNPWDAKQSALSLSPTKEKDRYPLFTGDSKAFIQIEV